MFKPRKKKVEKKSKRTKVPTPEGGHILIAAFQSEYLIGTKPFSHISATFRSAIMI